jgi:hypothetical protein
MSNIDGAPVSREKAALVGTNWIIQQAGILRNVPLLSSSTELIQGLPKGAVRGSAPTGFFVVSFSPAGFVVVSGDTVAQPVICYSATDTFSWEEMPPQFKAILEDAHNEIVAAATSSVRAPTDHNAAWERLSEKTLNANRAENVASDSFKLLDTTWGQGIYYNAFCPENSDYDGSRYDGHSMVGCVAVALAQIMRYNKHPTTGVGSRQYYEPSNDKTLSVDFSVQAYDFEKMPNSLSSHNEPLAEFLYHVGVSVEMNYGDGLNAGTLEGSGASNYKVLRALRENFRTHATLQRKADFSAGSAWKDLLKADLDQRHPVYYSGFSDEGGHAFVVDGYDQAGLFHINWGWNGAYQDVYYALDDLTAGYYSFNNSQVAIFEIYPSNDDFANAFTLSGDSGQAELVNTHATAEPGEPEHAVNNPRKSVWWSWTASKNGVLYVNTHGSDFDTVLAVYTGDRVDNLDEVGSNDNDATTDANSGLACQVEEGQDYHIAVDGSMGDNGNIVLEWQLGPLPAPGVAISAPTHNLANTGPVSYIVTYTGATTITLTADHVALHTTGTASAEVSVGGSGLENRTVTLENMTGDGTLSISIASDSAEDTSGNLFPSTGPSNTVVVDNILPAANNDILHTPINTPLVIQLAGTDERATTLTYRLLTPPQHGTIPTLPWCCQRVSVDSSGDQANLNTESLAISTDGSFIVFNSEASNLVADDTNTGGDIFVATRTLPTSPVTYTPDPNYVGEDQFQFVVSDGVNDSLPATVEITVNPLSGQSIFTASSSAGGAVVQPGEGDFQIGNGNIVTLMAQADQGYEFSQWVGSAVDAGKVTDPTASSTEVLVDADYTVHADFLASGAAFIEQGGLAVMETEHYHQTLPGTGDAAGHNWQETTTWPGYSGDGGMVTTPNVSYNCHDTTDGPCLEYKVDFTTADTYYVHVRLLGANGTDDSLHVGLDGICATLGGYGMSDPTGNWYWVNWITAYTGEDRVTVTVASPGIHTFNLWMREDGVAVDKIVLTTDPDYVPTSNGPDESPRRPGDPALTAVPGNLSFTTDEDWKSAGIRLDTSDGTTTTCNISCEKAVWLTVYSGFGNTPTSLDINVDPYGLDSGTYNAAITAFAPGYHSIAIPVNLIIPPYIVPANDDFANATVIGGTNGQVSGANFYATQEPGEPYHNFPGGKSVWWAWTAPADGVLTLNTHGSNFDTLLAIYTGTDVAALSEMGSNDDDDSGDYTSGLECSVKMGLQYHIAVDGYDDEAGSIVLNWVFSNEHEGRTLYVNLAAIGLNDGTSWQDAFTSLQTALDSAQSGDMIWAAAGTYYPTSDGNRSVSFEMKTGVAMFGGFAGGETSSEQRDWESNETILSGDIGIVDNSEDNSYHVVFGADNAILDGFVVEKAYADYESSSAAAGGGMLNDGVSPSINNCTFRGNSAGGVLASGTGGGMANLNGASPVINFCLFSGNSAGYEDIDLGYKGDGGGMYNSASSPTVTDCIFSLNTAHFGSGGGMCNNNAATSLEQCVFTDNEASWSGGGIDNGNASSLDIISCSFIANEARYCWRPGVIPGTGAAICNRSEATIVNCVFDGNDFSDGTGIYNSGICTVTNCTFTRNGSEDYDEWRYGAAIENENSSDLVLTNCILWDNNKEVNVIGSEVPLFRHCNIAGSGGSGASWNTVFGTDGGGNIDADPQFENGLNLGSSSPCIDAGLGDNGATVPETDILGNPRHDDPNMPNTGADTPDYVDIGAYERQTESGTATHSSSGYRPGGDCTVTCTITFEGSPSALGWEAHIPAGWTFSSDTSGADLTPNPGDEQLLSFAWYQAIPTSPVEFSYTLSIPGGESGDKQISAAAGVDSLQYPAMPNLLAVHPILWHAADYGQDWKINLFELLRVIQHFNYRDGAVRTGEYHADVNGVDGFAPGPGVQIPTIHSADYGQDWKINLFELLRVIQHFNYRDGAVRTGDYHVDASTVDGYAPGADEGQSRTARADGVRGELTATQSASLPSYIPGATVTVNCEITYETTPNSLGWITTIPPGWTFVSDTSGADLTPRPGDEQELNFAWYSAISSSPMQFSYILKIPNDESGTQSITGTAGADTSQAMATPILLQSSTIPTIISISSPTPNAAYNTGSKIDIEVQFSEPVTVTGMPRLMLEMGTTDRYATYLSGSGGTTLTFQHTVQSGDNSNDLDCTGTDSLELNGGSIKNATETDAKLTLPSPGAVNSLSANNSIVVDTAAPGPPTALDLAGSADTGNSDTDNITKNTTGLKISGEAEANSQVQLYDNGTAVGNTVAATGGVFSTDIDLAEGMHNVTAKATDAAGNQSGASTALTITVDNTLPVVSDDILLTPMDTPLEIKLTGTDERATDLTYRLLTPPQHGTLSPLQRDSQRTSVTSDTSAVTRTSHVTYTPNPSYVGDDQFQFLVNDGANDSLPGTVQITVYRQFTLAVSSSIGGSIVQPGEGKLLVDKGETVQLVAEATSGFVFSRWVGSAVDAGKVADPTASTTEVLVDTDYTLHADFISTATAFLEQNGQVTIEASHSTRALPGAGDAADHSWQETTTLAGYSGDCAMVTEPNTGVNCHDTTDGPCLEYEVEFTTAGTYYVWVRMLGTNAEDDSLHVGLDGVCASLDGAGLSDDTGSWVWVNQVTDRAEEERVTITVDTPGLHTFNLWMREDGVAVDKVVLAIDSAYVPIGT